MNSALEHPHRGGTSRRYLVTGGSGFVGTNLIERLISAHPDAAILSLDPSRPKIREHERFWTALDIRDGAAVSRAFTDFAPTDVVHLGARTDLEGRRVADYDSNTDGTMAIISASNKSKTATRVIYASSRLVCRIGYQPTADDDYCPPNAYGASKVEGELLVRRLATKTWTILRPTSIWGPWFGVPYRDFFDTVLQGRYVHVAKGPLMKSFGYVGNSVYQILRILEAPEKSVVERTLYLGDYPPIEVGAFADTIRQMSGVDPVIRVPEGFVRVAARVGDLLGGLGWSRVPLTTFRLNNLLTPMVYDLSALESVVGPLPYSADEGIHQTLDWLASRRSATTDQLTGS